MPARKAWKLVLTGPAERDLGDISAWTAAQFGPRQAEKYTASITALFLKLEVDPTNLPSRQRDELGPGFRTWHVGGRARHLLLYRIEGDRVVVLRILHDSMDIARHLPPGDE